ncbi:zf-HC2 domain-containing protein [Nonomuraea terrae]|uniref:Zf-HC2 domain-containing protein n=1 Tax=Nonomuraea terrae TaxID=2530383 RepID=A0A4R4YAW3_9ACTN|nr:zf-HC2 domain-containing protein [Nonomuraea terrae]TDD41675.1 zf-HC2 domain-containing protein [Nonomuraea terrae]
MKRFTCDELVEHLTAYLDDALDTPARDAVRDHLSCCEGCGRYFDQYRATIRVLGDLPTRPLPTETRSRLLSTFRTRRADHLTDG